VFEGGLGSLQAQNLTGKYWRPRAQSLLALGSVVVLDEFASRGRCLVGFQATISSTHALKSSGIAAFLQLAGAQGISSSNVIVVFVVPDTDVWGTWQTKRTVSGEVQRGKPARRRRRVLMMSHTQLRQMCCRWCCASR
jgi:hypothetical protein